MGERIPIPVESADVEWCGTCVGACCRKNTVMILKDDEYDFFIECNASLREYTPSEKYDNRIQQTVYGWIRILRKLNPINRKIEYLLEEDCPNLVEGVGGVAVCSVYNDPRRPEVCVDFPVGEYWCREMREKRQIPLPPNAPEEF